MQLWDQCESRVMLFIAATYDRHATIVVNRIQKIDKADSGFLCKIFLFSPLQCISYASDDSINTVEFLFDYYKIKS